MPNYFGKRRLEKIFFNYLNDRKHIIKEIKNECKEFSKDIIFQYRKYKGSEWFETSIYVNDVNYCFKFCSFGETCKTITLEEYQVTYNNDDTKVRNRTFYGQAYYDENFYPYLGEMKLRCYDINKSELVGESVTIYQSNDKKHFSLKPISDDGRYIEKSTGNVYQCILPPGYYVKGTYNIISYKGKDVFINTNEDGLPYLQHFHKTNTIHNKDFYSDNFLKIEIINTENSTKEQ